MSMLPLALYYELGLVCRKRKDISPFAALKMFFSVFALDALGGGGSQPTPPPFRPPPSPPSNTSLHKGPLPGTAVVSAKCRRFLAGLDRRWLLLRCSSEPLSFGHPLRPSPVCAPPQAEAQQAIGTAGFSAYEVRVSFIEVYREYAFDLLGAGAIANRDPSSACPLREQPDPLRVYADGANEERVTSAAQLLALVDKGAKNRATAATGVHEHSSRSHALLVLSVEHRWRDVGDPDSRRVKSQSARLTLVDLAGAETMERSHGGNFDAAGVGTNMGLLVLGRVIHALAAGERVPYRDSTLTRLLQTSLGGNAVTQMLTCVSPSAADADQTWRALQYASSARDVRCAPEVARVREELEHDPMHGDWEDEDTVLNRQAVWIETRGFGDVFARCVGDPSDPLILWVHGSGPKNSSMQVYVVSSAVCMPACVRACVRACVCVCSECAARLGLRVICCIVYVPTYKERIYWTAMFRLKILILLTRPFPLFSAISENMCYAMLLVLFCCVLCRCVYCVVCCV